MVTIVHDCQVLPGNGPRRSTAMLLFRGGMGWGGRDWSLPWLCRVMSGVDWPELDLVADRAGRPHPEWIWEGRTDALHGTE